MRELSSLSICHKSSNYSAYGYRYADIKITGLLGFNGEFVFTPSGLYHLGNGHRIYNPRLMRFISADALSPFRQGGINCYAYCLNDPVNSQDPSGRSGFKRAAVQVLAVNRFKKKLTSGKGNGSHLKALVNKEPENLINEMAEAGALMSAGSAFITLASDGRSLHDLPGPGFKHKFVFTRDKNLFIGSYSDGDLSHASIARYGQLGAGDSGEVISAGYISKFDGVFLLDNYSGHYQPPIERLGPPRDYLERLGMKIRLAE
ncbi:hypothetical protein CR511_11070 [Pseudomonas putida]|nr:hypothetical protein CR511_11070 [Pseudomonas putida]